jgi:predicted ester cyclase
MKNSIKLLVVSIISTTFLLLSSCDKKETPTYVQAILDKYVGFWNTGQFDGIEDVLDLEYELLESPSYEPQKGIELFKKTITDMLRTYPDFHLVINETIYEKDKIALIWTIKATNTGPGEMPATGRIIKGQGLSVIHLKNGKIKDEWLANNNLLWMSQLGFTLVPPTLETDQTK